MYSLNQLVLNVGRNSSDGGCHANNITLGGDLETPYEFGCRLQKKRIECAIMIQAELEQAGIDGSIPVALG